MLLIFAMSLFADNPTTEALTWTAVALSCALVIERMYGRYIDTKERLLKSERESKQDDDKRKFDSSLVELKEKHAETQRQVMECEEDRNRIKENYTKELATLKELHAKEYALIHKELERCNEKHEKNDARVEKLIEVILARKVEMDEMHKRQDIQEAKS